MKQSGPPSVNSFIPGWSLCPGDLSLKNDEVHVWRCSLDQDPHQIKLLESNLSENELKRAGRFKSVNGRIHFTVSRGVLRALLGRYLKLAPKDIKFRYGRHGKPSLAAESDSYLSFNVSHSGNVSLYAFAYKSRIGVDIEYMRGERNFQGIAERFYSSGEVTALNALSKDKQLEAFFRLWTCKEAYLKAIGTGLSFGLDKVEIDIADGTDSVLACVNGDADEAVGWTLKDLDVATGYAAALAVNGHGRDVRYWQWDSEKG